MPEDIRTLAYVLRRTNYGEADRILDLITPEGKRAVMARGVRKARSKLAGAVEMFCLLDMNLHFGRGELGVVTGSQMRKYHAGVLKEVERLECATTILKRVGRVAEMSDSEELFRIADQSLTALSGGANVGLVRTWAELNLAKASGEQVNLQVDTSGETLVLGERYEWDAMEAAFCRRPDGRVDDRMIKLMRLMWVSELLTVMRVKGAVDLVPEIWKIVRAINKI